MSSSMIAAAIRAELSAFDGMQADDWLAQNDPDLRARARKYGSTPEKILRNEKIHNNHCVSVMLPPIDGQNIVVNRLISNHIAPEFRDTVT
jgi:hypothetical protein